MNKRITTSASVLLAIVCLVAIAYTWNQYINWYETGESQATVPWLPDYASNVSFARTNGWKIFEFDVTEANFRKWAAQYALTEINEPFYIERFNNSDSVGIGGSKSELVNPHDYELSTVAIIRDGLKYYSWKNSGGGVSVCFDRNTSRAYFHSRRR